MTIWPNSNGAGSPLSEGQADLRKRFGIEQFEPGAIGFAPKSQKWYGWSHRAVYGFGVGHTVKKGDVVAGDFAQPGRRFPVGFQAKTLADARALAVAFADAVS